MKPSVGRIVRYFGPLAKGKGPHVEKQGLAAIVTEVPEDILIDTSTYGEVLAIGVNVQMPVGAGPVMSVWLPANEDTATPDGSYWTWPLR